MTKRVNDPEKTAKKYNRQLFGAPMFSSFRPYELWSDEEWAANYVYETLISLKAENEREKDNAPLMQNIINYEGSAELIWSAAHEFQLKSECKYIAIDLFNRFIVKHAASLVEYVFTKTKAGNKREKIMKELERRIHSQAPLRSLTCLMIASKLVSHNRIINGGLMRDFMKKLNIKFKVEQIMRSEIRVLEQLEYKCFHSSSLMVHVGVLVTAILGVWKIRINQEVKQVRHEDLFETSMAFIDIACLKFEKLYKELFFLATGSRVIPDDVWPAWSRIVADRLLLAASAVTGAGWVLGGDPLCETVVVGITTNIHLHTEDLESLTACLLHISDVSPEISYVPSTSQRYKSTSKVKKRQLEADVSDS